ncbi:MAG: DNA polymerase III subunit chi [Gammaproteobacteria bacterium]|nr:DNA polymerase III subunit chi [Gammaproteobacteria bacterium]
MTSIDFYILRSTSDDARLELACRIAEKAMLREQHVFICPASQAEARRLDELLWTFSQGSFVPHRVVTSEEQEQPPEPVLIGHGAAPMKEPLTDRWDVLINLSSDVPEFFSRYTRVAEVVDSEEQRRERGRERYRYYRDRGYTLNTHQV